MRFVIATRHVAGLGPALRLKGEGHEVVMAVAGTDDWRLEDRYALLGIECSRSSLADMMRDRNAWRDAWWVWDENHSVDEDETLCREQFTRLERRTRPGCHRGTAPPKETSDCASTCARDQRAAPGHLEKLACADIFRGGRATARLMPIDRTVMPNATRQSGAPSQDPMTVVRSRADALYRAAIECCRQHDRSAKLSGDEEPELEHQHLDALCKLCDGSLAEISDAYTAAAAHVHPDRDEAWWHKANGLWHASREYARRHAGCDALARGVAAKHSAGNLASMQMEYELEASALLALRHAADAYLKTRPGLS